MTEREDENEQIAQRKAKLAELKEQGFLFPNDFRPTAQAAGLHEAYENEDGEKLEAQAIEVAVAGRIMLKRIMGKASFIQLQDGSGRIQLYVQRDRLPEGAYAEFKKWDLGDIIGATGHVFKTKTGELSVRVTGIKLLTKSLRPLPEKFHGLQDQELRHRRRYLDLIMNESSRRLFVLRTRAIAAMREFLTGRGFMEVETPMMHPIPGGATAKPFVTHHNALSMDMFLRIAPELYLKRLVVGGFEKVFEVNRNFRNEGVSIRHNPEFTMLEAYQAYGDYRDVMDLSEGVLRAMADAALNSRDITYQGQTLDFAKPFRRLLFHEALVAENADLNEALLNDEQGLRAWCDQKGIPLEASMALEKIQLEIFEKTVEKNLIQPTFIVGFPAKVSPLARRNDQQPDITDRFELFVAGYEIANGFSELNDPVDQAERFRQQIAEREAGDDEAMHYDPDFIRALEYGMPPTAGVGLGIDRIIMLLTDAASIREVLLFPHLRPEA